MPKARILFLDIETAPIIAAVWGIHDQNIGLDQIIEDWSILSWCAKWLGDDHTYYEDVRHQKNLRDDKKILQKIWKLLNEADIIITQNGKHFDEKKLNTRFLLNGMHPPSRFKHLDTLQIAKGKFAFTSNKLEYMSKTVNVVFKKLDHKEFPGYKLWKECLDGNMKAWKDMEAYNKHDVLALEELYNKFSPWDNSVNFSVYDEDDTSMRCNCGSTAYVKDGHNYTNTGKFQRYRCQKCGAPAYDKAIKANNKLSLAKQKSLKAMK